MNIKNCPFCGSKKIEHFPEHMGHSDLNWVIECQDCGVLHVGYKDAVIETWNTRPIEDMLTANLITAEEAHTAQCGQIAVKDAEIARLTTELEQRRLDNRSLVAQMNEMAVKCQWISVDDRLPDVKIDAYYLSHIKNNGAHTDNGNPLEFNQVFYWLGGKWYFDIDQLDIDYPNLQVTHWMPIPELV